MPSSTTPEVRSIPSPSETLENEEISIHYMTNGTIWHRKDIQISDQFAHFISQDITNIPPDPKTVREAQNGLD